MSVCRCLAPTWASLHDNRRSICTGHPYANRRTEHLLRIDEAAVIRPRERVTQKLTLRVERDLSALQQMSAPCRSHLSAGQLFHLTVSTSRHQ